MKFYQAAGFPGFHAHDSSAISYLIDPSLFKTQKLFVDVEYRSPHHYGQTVADWRGQRKQAPNVNVCLDVDSERLLDLHRRRLMGASAL